MVLPMGSAGIRRILRNCRIAGSPGLICARMSVGRDARFVRAIKATPASPTAQTTGGKMTGIVRKTDDTRQGETGHGVRYVLGFSLFAAWAALSLIVIFS